ncbi:MAG: metal ABC transporter ATP-binding protein [Candidatus Thiodiazotropha sp. (ex Lucina pensylvanica)]|nr:metal ABC transporter ATP-binding protein [Candidatus Thiodiazotropha taylori]MBT3057279.1 metal ABC transporter ATP-binding protein [Candidatus Thiodiazotropha sp. (ex Lucina pensylvanica)]MBT3061178.1 metal ABC transporter ATP-binding protein [Candidatus Thiodiazotropha sp. (ex Lucina pensylvanica)]MBV2094078.1 metal ABC transporter ATP-binding protein [Candidatus Thiodiazotropha sp. (ex Codakia orbicularis)]PUB77745.1 MAG: metal ABC transporter ATP-binding protein [gamma proteobacterium s
MKRFFLTGLIGVTLIAGCASKPTEIQSTYVSPLEYRDYDCTQISMELTRVNRRTNQLHGELDEKASGDSAQMAIGMLLFWPALFFLEGGDGPQAAEYAQLKGEFDALEKAAIKKECDVGEFEKIRQARAEMAKKQEPQENLGPELP